MDLFETKKYDILSRSAKWDKPTQKIIEKRLWEIPKIVFFKKNQNLAEAILDFLVPNENSLPVLNFLDDDILKNRTIGYRYKNEPLAKEVWKLFMNEIELLSEKFFKKSFVQLSYLEQNSIMKEIRHGTSPSVGWSKIGDPEAIFRQLLSQVAGIYYSQPFAWNEIGWAGPVYPESYFVQGCCLTEPWEPKEKECNYYDR